MCVDVILVITNWPLGSHVDREVCDLEVLVEQHGSEILSARDEWGYTPAHWAALDGNLPVMRYLVERGAPVDLSCLGTQGQRPIHWACRKGHAAIVQVLLKVICTSFLVYKFI